MLTTIAAALALASSLTMDVPFVPQTDALCGGAAAAMVFRYYGDAHADVEQFAPLVERRPGGVVGIADTILASAVRSRGWRTEHVGGSVAALRARLDARQPVIVLLEDRGNQYHYVVVVGATGGEIIVHDPSWGPSRHLTVSEFDSLWAASKRWSLVILPGERGVTTSTPAPEKPLASDASPSAGGAAASTNVDPCEALLNSAIDTVRERGLDQADEILAPVRARCPSSAGPLRELAGVRFAQHRWPEAASLARAALDRQRDDAYALDVLGSSLFVQDDPVGALRAWNRIGKPRLDLVTIEGIRHARYQAITDYLQLQPNTPLTADAFLRAKHRLDDLPDRATARLAVRPEADGFANVDVVIAERSGIPQGIAWAGAAVRAAVDREASIALPGFAGQGDVWSASWRWWSNRPRVAIGFAAPRVGGLFGVWRVDASWEAETYANGGSALVRESRTHGGLTVSDWMTGRLRYELRAGVDEWNSGRRAASIGAAIERRWMNDRVSVGGDVTEWAGLRHGSGFSAAGARALARTSPAPRVWAAEATVGVERVSDDAPLAIWPGAGEGRARSALLRAHPLLDEGIIDLGPRSTFGRTLGYASVEGQRWFAQPRLVRIGVAAFVDVARADRRAAAFGTTQLDVGAGVRVRVPGTTRVLRIDVAHGLRDGANAVTVGWTP